MMSDTITTYLLYTLAFPTAFWLVAYLLPQIYMSTIRPVPDLKKWYNATWALVTGSGSGIGKALAFKLASQGLNVVLVSLDDEHLKNTVKQLEEKYPELEFRAVGASFSPGVNYLEDIEKATKDITIQCIFNNAGFIVTGFVDQTPLGKWVCHNAYYLFVLVCYNSCLNHFFSRLLANVECNATASFVVAHHFLQKLVTNKQKGCIVFTSSVAGFIPTPFAASYAATKAFVSQLACSLHIEVQALGIDVCAVHPSPVASNFYEKVSFWLLCHFLLLLWSKYRDMSIYCILYWSNMCSQNRLIIRLNWWSKHQKVQLDRKFCRMRFLGAWDAVRWEIWEEWRGGRELEPSLFRSTFSRSYLRRQLPSCLITKFTTKIGSSRVRRWL